MARDMDKKGDFGLPRRRFECDQVVGIYDLVGFTELPSNKDLVQAVSMLETELELKLSDNFYWGEIDPQGDETVMNDVLLRSTGDGYVVAFSQHVDTRQALDTLTEIHKRVNSQHKVRLGISKGSNYVVKDLNERVNIVGAGINFAARALEFADGGQIICTGQFALPLMDSDNSLKKLMQNLGKQRIKNDDLELYNYYKAKEFGKKATKKTKTHNRNEKAED